MKWCLFWLWTAPPIVNDRTLIADRRARLVAVDAWLLERSSFELWALAAVAAVVFALAVIALQSL